MNTSRKLYNFLQPNERLLKLYTKKQTKKKQFTYSTIQKKNWLIIN